jgi:hypothetical protein
VPIHVLTQIPHQASFCQITNIFLEIICEDVKADFRHSQRHGSIESEIVAHNPRILALFRCHHCLEILHSDQAIGYVLEYCTNNSDGGKVALKTVLYQGQEVDQEQKLQ